MNAVRKAAFAASALAITLLGAAFVTAPMAFAGSVPVAAQEACSTASQQMNLAGQAECRSVSPAAGLIALNLR